MAVDYFLKLDNVKGESKVEGYEEWIQLESWSWGETQGGGMGYGGGGGAGKVAMQDFHFVMRMNNASPFLFLHCTTGEHFKKANLVCRKAGGSETQGGQKPYLKIDFEDVLISSYQIGGSAHGDDIPHDQISFNFSKIEYEYFVQDEKGQVTSAGKKSYNVKTAKAA